MEQTLWIRVPLVLVTVLTTVVQGLPTGAPESACESMTPRHGTEQTSTNPYSITVDGGATTYTPGSIVTGRYTAGWGILSKT